MAPTIEITEASDSSDVEEIREMRARLEAKTVTQEEFDRFIIGRLEKAAKAHNAEHKLLHEIVESIRDVRDEMRIIRRTIYGVCVGAFIVWFIFTQTNIRPKPGAELPDVGMLTGK